MDKPLIYRMLSEKYSGITFESKYEENKIEITASNITAKKHFDDSIYIRIINYDSGTLHVFMTFDRLDKTLNALSYINTFNACNAFYKGYISEKKGGNYFELHFAVFGLTNESAVVNQITFSLDELLSENTLKHLKPITELTYA